MTKKQLLPFIIVNIFFWIATVTTDILYMKLGNPYIFKTLASITFVLCAISNCFIVLVNKSMIKDSFVYLMLAGQFFAMFGDILLIDNFMLGAIFFAIGHIFYFFAFCSLKPFKLLDFAYIGIAICVSVIIILLSGVKLGTQLPLILSYALVISFMLGKSSTLFNFNKLTGFIIFVGSLFFYLSDMFLMFYLFGGKNILFDNLCLIFYYPAQFILAMSIGATVLINIHSTNKEKISDK